MAYPKPNDVSMREKIVANLSLKSLMRSARLEPKTAASAAPNRKRSM